MKIFVLTTTINGRKNFVANLMSNRGDNKKIVNYATDINMAKDFGSEIAAENFIDEIVNPHDRIFTPEIIDVDEKQWQPLADAVEDHIK